jgi:hypothetical protein
MPADPRFASSLALVDLPVPLLALALIAAVAAAALGGYFALAAVAWARFGRVRRPRASAGRDDLLDLFMPSFDVVERHHIRVAAPAAIVLAAARDQDLFGLPLVRAIFRAREIVLGTSAAPAPPRGLLAATLAMGWGVLAESPDREIVVGAVTRPWEANVVFRAIEPARFASFREPGGVKIAWTLRADPIDPQAAMFRTETRVAATDAAARARFRRYWAFASPGIAAIRWLSLRPLRREAERRAAAARSPAPAPTVPGGGAPAGLSH